MKLAAKYHYAILLVICCLTFFSHLSALTPTIMEARNFISAREMLESGNWLIPTLNGNTRIRKPPLPTWFTATAITTAGDPNNLTALRFPAAIIATILICFLYGLVKDLFKNTTIAFYSAAVLATSYMFIEESKTGAWDIYCTAFMLGGIWMFYRAVKTKTNSLRYWILAGVLMGCSFMSKGPVSFYAMLVPFLSAYFITKNGLYAKSRSGLLLCLLITITISAAWPLYLYMKIPGIATAIVDEETGAWINRHNRPVWFYLHFPLFTGIWSALVIYTLARMKTVITFFETKKVLLILYWFLITVVLLSVVPEKKERYFLPALIPLAILVGAMIAYHLKELETKFIQKKDLIMIRVQGVLMVLVGLGIPVFLWFFALQSGEVGLLSFLLLSLISLGLAFIVIYTLNRKRLKYIYSITIAIMMFFCLTSWSFLPEMDFDNPKYRDLREVRHIDEITKRPLYSLTQLNPERLWEIGRHINFIENEPLPEKRAVIINSRPMPRAKIIHKFHYDPESDKNVLYFNVFE